MSGVPPADRPLERLARAALPVLALVVFGLFTGATLAVAGDTLGYDFLAYHAAAARVLDGQPLYDTSFQAAGGFGLFYYPPPFAPLVLPFGLLDAGPATWSFIGLSLVAFVGAVAILPVSPRTRWLVLLLAGLSWPFVYAIKLGQVGPVLFLAFAVGWRWLDRPGVVGVAAALGAAIKIQPGLVFGWALFTRRLPAVLIGVAVLAGLAVLATLLAGPAAWPDFALLIGRVTDPITTPKNFTPGAVAFQLGLARDAAALLQLGAMGLAGLAWLAAIRWCRPDASYQATIIVSQLVSPILWDHYAMLLLLPIAWLWERGARWAAIVPLVSAVPLVGLTPAIAYPASFALVLAAVLWVGRRERGAGAMLPSPTTA